MSKTLSFYEYEKQKRTIFKQFKAGFITKDAYFKALEELKRHKPVAEELW